MTTPDHAPADRRTVVVQRVENTAIAAVAGVLFVHQGFAWYLLAGLFLVFDASMVGYLRGPALGARVYNAVHSYLGPAVLGAAAVLGDLRWAAFVALLWAFHVGVDRALGYGLKHADGFQHTHLGWIGRRDS